MPNFFSIGLVSFFAFTSFAQTSSILWKCETDDRARGGEYHSVSLERTGQYLLKLLFSFKPAINDAASVPEVKDLELGFDFRCHFNANPTALIQCVSTNFLNSLETISLPTTPPDHPGGGKWLVKVKSNYLTWPDFYQDKKQYGHAEFVVDLSHPETTCGVQIE
jgi:hypothetical protein